MGKATLQGDKTMAAPREHSRNYLELAPTGPNADSAKALLASISFDRGNQLREGAAATPKKIMLNYQASPPFLCFGSRRSKHLLSFALGPRRGTVETAEISSNFCGACDS